MHLTPPHLLLPLLAAACASSTTPSPTPPGTPSDPATLTLPDHTTHLCTPSLLPGTLPQGTPQTQATLTLDGQPFDLTLDPGPDGAFAIDLAPLHLTDACPADQAPCTLSADLTASVQGDRLSATATLTLTDDGTLDRFVDLDGDTYGDDRTAAQPVCPTDPGFVDRQGDCNDGDPDFYPGAPEVLLDPDYNCDSEVICYLDSDQDSFGTTAGTPQATTIATAGGPSDCTAVGVSGNDLDCDDDDITINPDGAETPGNNVDENCDDRYECHIDDDVDGFTGSNSGLTPIGTDCTGAGFAIIDEGDCNDADGAFYPFAPEAVGDPDFDCDGFIDCYDDTDDDGFGDPLNTVSVSVVDEGDPSTCGTTPLTADNSDDCAIGDGTSYPDAPEIACDGIVQDCDGTAAADARVAIVTGPTFEPTDTTFDGLPEAQLQAAFDNVSPDGSDTVRLCDGDVYQGPLFIDKPMVVEGDGLGSTLDGGYTFPTVASCLPADQSVLHVDGSTWTGQTLTLRGLLITGGCQESTILSEHGGGLEVQDAAVNLEDVDIEFNASAFGGGLALRGTSEVRWTGGRLFGNQGTSGGGAWVDTNGALFLEDGPYGPVTVGSNNATGNGGGLYVNGVADLASSDVTSNTATGNGGGLYVNGNTDIEVSTFTGNGALLGISAYIIGEASPGVPNELTFTGLVNNDPIANVYCDFGGVDSTDAHDVCDRLGCRCDSGSCP